MNPQLRRVKGLAQGPFGRKLGQTQKWVGPTVTRNLAAPRGPVLTELTFASGLLWELLVQPRGSAMPCVLLWHAFVHSLGLN